MHTDRFQKALRRRLTHVLAGVVAASILSGCEFFPFLFEETPKRPVPISKELSKKRSFIPIIYPDRVVELDPRTGRERTIPDEDLIVENGKVWGRYIRLGDDIKFTMSYHNHLCAPVYTTDIETIGDSSLPARTFAIPDQKYDDCKEEDMKRAVNRIQEHQAEYSEFNRETLRLAPPEIISPSN